jgi:hypothetical protein
MFDGSELQSLGEMESIVESEGKVHATKLVVTEASKNHGLFETDLINIDESHVSIAKLYCKTENLN